MALRKCACIDTLYTELPFLERFAAARRDGFESVEFWDWRVHELDAVRNAAQKSGVKISGFNGDADFSLIDPLHMEPYLVELKRSVQAAKQVGAESVTIHSNALGDGGVVVNHYTGLSYTVKLCTMYEMLKKCAVLAEESGIAMNLEALNITTDHVGNFLVNTSMAAELCRMVGSPKLKILFDAYHMQLNEGSLCDNLTAYADQLGHIHVADAPGRHEPGTGEINYSRVFKHLEDIGYSGRLGYELFPLTDTKTAVAAIMTV